MDEKVFKRIKTLTELKGTSGFEYNVKKYMIQEMTPFVDYVQEDGLGGVFGVRENTDDYSPRIMFAAHMDEVGFMLAQITSNGLFKVLPLGGWNPYVVSAQRFVLTTREGVEIPVVSSSVPPHLLRGNNNSQDISVESILFDAGFISKEEAESFGVRPGDTIIPVTETILTANKKRIMAKAWDNRYGCTVVLDTLEDLKDTKLPNTLIAGANVQEEVGLRGAKGSTTLFNPDIFFAIDCSPANDLDGSSANYGHLGKGVLIRIQDPGFILQRGMREFLLDTAETHHIPYQYFVSKGGTDAGAAHQANYGVPSAVIGMCARYIHTHQTLFEISDYEAAKEMAKQIALTLDKSVLATIKSRN